MLRHPVFAGTTFFDVRNPVAQEFEANYASTPSSASIEGGDVLVLDAHTLMIGTGERTSSLGLALLLGELVSEPSQVRTVIQVMLPQERASMHLDTVFTRASEDHCVIYAPVLSKARFLEHRHPFTLSPVETDLARVLSEHHLGQPVVCGGPNRLSQSREQWTDG